MQQTDTNAAPTPRPKTRFFVVIALVAALIGGAGLIRYQFGPAAEDPMRGDADDTPAALAAALNKLPKAQQEAQTRKYTDDPSPGLRYAAIDRLAGQKNPANADALERAYTDSASLVRQQVLESLSNADSERGLRLLMAGLHDEDVWMREAAIGQVKVRMRGKTTPADQRIIPALISVLDDDSAAVSSVAVNTLQKMTGNPWGYKNAAPAAEKAAVHARWKAWWDAEKKKGTISMEFAQIAGISPTRTDPAPDFSLTDIDAKPLSLAKQRGKVTLLNFWGTWCPPCQQEIPDLVRLDKEYRAKGVDVVGIALNEESADSLRKWCASHGVAYRQAQAVESIQHAYGDIHEVPVSVLIDADGKIRRRWEGERDYNTFRRAVDSVLKP